MEVQIETDFWSNLLKGTVSRDFLLLVFFINQFPPAPEYPIWAVSNFFENSRRYSQIKVDHRCRWHRWQMKKSSIRKILIILLGHLWIVEVTHIYIFAFKFTLRYLQPDINPIVCHRCRWYRWQFCRRCRWHRWQICHQCRWYRWSTLSCEYIRKFLKKFETALMVYSRAWKKLIHEKNQKQKISWHCPFKYCFFDLIYYPDLTWIRVKTNNF